MNRNNETRIMVDMSATLIHHGHIRLLKEASRKGKVIVGLTTDDEIKLKKLYEPELKYEYRKEILDAIKYVDEVVPTPWHISADVLKRHKIDLLIHGDDNTNTIATNQLITMPRTPGVSSTQIRHRALKAITQTYNYKLMLTPGPSVVLYENLKGIRPLFGRGDRDYDQLSNDILEWLKRLSGQDEIITAQGSATFALELAAQNFVRGKVLLISTGYYSDRIRILLHKDCKLVVCDYNEIDNVTGRYDWVISVYTETSTAFKIDINRVRKLSDKLNALLYLDATGSIGLEDNHHMADLIAFSSCKGLFGLTGACFVAYKNNLIKYGSDLFYMDISTHENKKITGPYHVLASLNYINDIHDDLKYRVMRSKQHVMDTWSEYLRSTTNQPLLCTYLNGKLSPNDNKVVMYQPRSSINGSIICHLGEVFHDELNITKRISISGDI